jgi:hypothetical protein
MYTYIRCVQSKNVMPSDGLIADLSQNLCGYFNERNSVMEEASKPVEPGRDQQIGLLINNVNKYIENIKLAALYIASHTQKNIGNDGVVNRKDSLTDIGINIIKTELQMSVNFKHMAMHECSTAFVGGGFDYMYLLLNILSKGLNPNALFDRVIKRLLLENEGGTRYVIRNLNGVVINEEEAMREIDDFMDISESFKYTHNFNFAFAEVAEGKYYYFGEKKRMVRTVDITSHAIYKRYSTQKRTYPFYIPFKIIRFLFSSNRNSLEFIKSILHAGGAVIGRLYFKNGHIRKGANCFCHYEEMDIKDITDSKRTIQMHFIECVCDRKAPYLDQQVSYLLRLLMESQELNILLDILEIIYFLNPDLVDRLIIFGCCVFFRAPSRNDSDISIQMRNAFLIDQDTYRDIRERHDMMFREKRMRPFSLSNANYDFLSELVHIFDPVGRLRLIDSKNIYNFMPSIRYDIMIFLICFFSSKESFESIYYGDLLPEVQPLPPRHNLPERTVPGFVLPVRRRQNEVRSASPPARRRQNEVRSASPPARRRQNERRSPSPPGTGTQRGWAYDRKPEDRLNPRKINSKYLSSIDSLLSRLIKLNL